MAFNRYPHSQPEPEERPDIYNFLKGPLPIPDSDYGRQIYTEMNGVLIETYKNLVGAIDNLECQDRKLQDFKGVINHNNGAKGDTNSENHSDDQGANECYLSESTKTITARRYVEGEASNEQDNWQESEGDAIEGSTFMPPTQTSVIPVMDSRSYMPCLLSTRSSMTMASPGPHYIE